MWKQIFRQNFHRSISSSSNEIFTNDLLRKRLSPYITKTSYVDELSEIAPKLKERRKASVLLPLYCNQITNQVEILVLKRSDKVRSHKGMVGKTNFIINMMFKFRILFSISWRNL
jgi:hypothetical protein